MERVAYVAALGAAVSVAALGYAVMWGVDLSEPPPAEVVAAPPPQAPLDIKPEPQRAPSPVVFAPLPPAQDAPRAGSTRVAHVAANPTLVVTDRPAAEPPAADDAPIQQAAVPPEPAPVVAAPPPAPSAPSPAVAAPSPTPPPVPATTPAPAVKPAPPPPQAAITPNPAPGPRVVRPTPASRDSLVVVRGATPDAGPRLVQPGALILQLPPR